ncbi:molecular chaperone FimC [Atlantibacter subterranea]|uniref:Molecular chaperone FimC n=1 Tax=Atlantibacter subterraneus TaxID=255519 RepID=A0A3R9EXA1_9ENTR|nr:fimbria/pilus periplasmic chaperone [Atlantibacter subterranea]MDA3131345.1 fimbria/pilus periplasmic chaperone [Atlantibacter subterranea]RSB61044.1 molecular chaperone FimC [Atlantibacter subterranea]RSE05490.1 molecular chaperone FimC [Atlantibacter subterranea]RSE23859.1 molecular chaperone FimC [Atlantibacter subterranea]
METHQVNPLCTIACLLSLCAVNCAYAGGVALGATRVIYPQGDKQISLPLTNSSDSTNFLIQSWVSDAAGKKSADFVITPPLFVMHPKKENTLRIMYVGPDLPQDRESVFYLNSKAIPSVDKAKLTGSNLQIATQSVIKLFVRPKNLPTPSVESPKTLHCQASGGKVMLSNPSPYYITLVQFYSGGTKLPNSMVAPKGSLTVDIPGGKSGSVTFQTLNDFGANTPTQTCAG